jgi:membrane protease YdiL (CAAX protease family)
MSNTSAPVPSGPPPALLPEPADDWWGPAAPAREPVRPLGPIEWTPTPGGWLGPAPPAVPTAATAPWGAPPAPPVGPGSPDSWWAPSAPTEERPAPRVVWAPAPVAREHPSGTIGVLGLLASVAVATFVALVMILRARGLDSLVRPAGGSSPDQAARLFTTPMFVVSTAAMQVTMLLGALLACAFVTVPLRRALGYRSESGGHVLGAVGAALGARVLSLVAAATAAHLLGAQAADQLPGNPFHGVWAPMVVLLVVAGAPLAEETLFRGVLQSAWSARIGGRGAVLACALFLLCHLSSFAVAGAVVTVAGLLPAAALLTWLRARYSTTMSLVAHATFNLSAIVLVVAFGS